MTIQTVTNPVDNTEVTLVEGVISRIMYKPVNGGVDKFGNTHNASINVDGTWINFISMKVKEGREPQLQKVTGAAPNLEWHDINEGDTVKVVVKVGEYNGKPQYSTGTSKINIIKKGEAKAPTSQPKASSPASTSKAAGTKVFGDIVGIESGVAEVKTDSGEVKVVLGSHEKDVVVGGRLAAVVDEKGNIVSGFKAYGAKVAKDDLGIRVGNSFSVAMEAGFVTASKDITDSLPDVLQAIDDAKAEVAKDNSSMDAYALGARFGQSVIAAARFAKKGTTIDKIILEAKVIFDNLNQVEDAVRNKASQEKLEPTKTVSTVEEPASDIPFNDGSDIAGGVDFDDDIPF